MAEHSILILPRLSDFRASFITFSHVSTHITPSIEQIALRPFHGMITIATTGRPHWHYILF